MPHTVQLARQCQLTWPVPVLVHRGKSQVDSQQVLSGWALEANVSSQWSTQSFTFMGDSPVWTG